MTAHLTLAQALSRQPLSGPVHALAEAVLLTLMNRQKDALAKTAAFASVPELEVWGRALRARNTGDPRELAAIQRDSLLEQVAYFAAVSRSAEATLASEFLTSRNLV
jgi:hypothetical protein